MTGTFHIVVAMKPLDGNFAENAVRHGVAGLNVDVCKIGMDVMTTHSRGKTTAFPKRPGEKSVEDGWRMTPQNKAEIYHVERSGRWPANVIHDGSEGVVDAFPMTMSGKAEIGMGTVDCPNKGIFGPGKGGVVTSCYADSGSAARFFFQVKEYEI